MPKLQQRDRSVHLAGAELWAALGDECITPVTSVQECVLHPDEPSGDKCGEDDT